MQPMFFEAFPGVKLVEEKTEEQNSLDPI